MEKFPFFINVVSGQVIMAIYVPLLFAIMHVHYIIFVSFAILN